MVLVTHSATVTAVVVSVKVTVVVALERWTALEVAKLLGRRGRPPLG